jgi:hypothetical protein
MATDSASWTPCAMACGWHAAEFCGLLSSWHWGRACLDIGSACRRHFWMQAKWKALTENVTEPACGQYDSSS